MNEPPFASGLAVGLILLACPNALLAQAGPSANATVPFTNAQQIVALGTNISPDTLQARLQAVVIYVSGSRRLYVQDGEHGLQVNLTGTNEPIRVGHKIEI